MKNEVFLIRIGKDYTLYNNEVCRTLNYEEMAKFLYSQKVKVIVAEFNEDINDLINYGISNETMHIRITEHKSKIYKVQFGKATILSLYNYLPDSESIKVALDNTALLIVYNQIKGYFNTILHSIGAHKTAERLENLYTVSQIAFEALKETSSYSKLCKKTTKTEYDKYKTAYRAGFVLARPGVYDQVHQIDKISAYPSVYSYTCLPIGRPFTIPSQSALKHVNFYIVNITTRFKLKKGYIPFISIPLYYGISEYVEETDEYINLTLSKRDFELFQEYYDAEIIFNWADGWRTTNNLFANYGSQVYNYKSNSDGIYRAIAKYLLNTPYGKFGKNGKITEYAYQIENGERKKKIIKQSIKSSCLENLPLAIAITSEVRYQLLCKAKEISFDKIIYMHTDSIKGFFDTSHENGYKMGDWKVERTATKMAIREKMRYARFYLDERIENGEYVPYYIADYTVSGVKKEIIKNIYSKEFNSVFLPDIIKSFMSDKAFESNVFDSENLTE